MKEGEEKTLPWAASEYINVNGHPLVYTMVEAVPHIHFPGGYTMTRDEAKLAGYQVLPPKHWRAYA